MTCGYDGVLKVESEGGVRIVTPNDPDKLNAMTDPLHEALVDVWVHIMRDTDPRVVVITGAGRAFSAGGDIPGFVKNVEDIEYRRVGMRNARMLTDHILGCHLPVIAAVNGPAVGLGCSLAMSSDIVLMSQDAYWRTRTPPSGWWPATAGSSAGRSGRACSRSRNTCSPGSASRRGPRWRSAWPTGWCPPTS